MRWYDQVKESLTDLAQPVTTEEVRALVNDRSGWAVLIRTGMEAQRRHRRKRRRAEEEEEEEEGGQAAGRRRRRRGRGPEPPVEDDIYVTARSAERERIFQELINYRPWDRAEMEIDEPEDREEQMEVEVELAASGMVALRQARNTQDPQEEAMDMEVDGEPTVTMWI
jgi:hypothetical protein